MFSICEHSLYKELLYPSKITEHIKDYSQDLPLNSLVFLSQNYLNLAKESKHTSPQPNFHTFLFYLNFFFFGKNELQLVQEHIRVVQEPPPSLYVTRDQIKGLYV